MTTADRIEPIHPGEVLMEDFIEGFRPSDRRGGVELSLESGIFKRVCAEATSFPQRGYLIVIDEINRDME